MQVLESRAVDGGKLVRRRRYCTSCKKRFTTHERADSILLWVHKKNGGREPFDREKIRRGVLRAVEKRPVEVGQVDGLIDMVEREMLKKDSSEVQTHEIGKVVLKHLNKLDKVAWLRFASVYMEFENLEDFLKVLKK